MSQPVQRVCRYPLLFADLCKHTPVYDDPESFGEVAKALNRLKEVAQEANSATHDPGKRRLIETTWLLQDRLAFEAEVSPSMILLVTAKNVRSLVPPSSVFSAVSFFAEYCTLLTTEPRASGASL